MGGGDGAQQPPARLDPAGRFLVAGGCAPLPPPAGPSTGTRTGGHWEGQVEAKGSAGLINHPFPLLCLFSQPFPPLPCICAHPLCGCLWCRGLCRALQTERCCGCAGLSPLDAAAVTAVEVTWVSSSTCHVLALPCCCLNPSAECWAGSAPGKGRTRPLNTQTMQPAPLDEQIFTTKCGEGHGNRIPPSPGPQHDSRTFPGARPRIRRAQLTRSSSLHQPQAPGCCQEMERRPGQAGGSCSVGTGDLWTGTGSLLSYTLVHGATSPAWECDMGYPGDTCRE